MPISVGGRSGGGYSVGGYSGGGGVGTLIAFIVTVLLVVGIWYFW